MSLVGRLIKNITYKVADWVKDTRIPVVYDVGGAETDGYIKVPEMISAISAPIQSQIDALTLRVSQNESDISDNSDDIIVNIADIQQNEDDIADTELDVLANISDISDLDDRVTVLEGQGIVLGADYAVDSGNADSINSSTATYIQAGAFNAELVAQKTDGTTKFFVQAVATFTEGAGAQKGVKLKLEYSRNNGTWTDMPTGSTSGNTGGGYQESVNSSTTDTVFHQTNIFAAMSITLAGTYRFRLVFAAFVSGSNIVYKGSNYDGMIMAQEIKM